MLGKVPLRHLSRKTVYRHPAARNGYGVPDAGEGLEIDFMEVADGYRRHGFGTQAVGLLRRLHPGRTVFARPPESEDAFWQSRAGTTPATPGAGTIPRCSCSADNNPPSPKAALSGLCTLAGRWSPPHSSKLSPLCATRRVSGWTGNADGSFVAPTE
jgi:hypothetical protein